MICRGRIALLLLGLTAAAAGATRPTELTGLLTQIDGAVQLAGPGVREAPLASPWQVIRSGVTVRLPRSRRRRDRLLEPPLRSPAGTGVVVPDRGDLCHR